MGAGLFANLVTINSVLVRNSNGVAMLNHYTANPGTATMEFFHNPHSATRGDVMASFSSRRADAGGRRSSRTLLLRGRTSSRAATQSGRSRRAVHRLRIGLRDEHGDSPRCGCRRAPAPAPPVVDAGDGQVGADDDGDREVFLNNAKTQRAGVLDRGAGRIDLAQAGNPGLAVDKPSLSGGETSAGASKTFTVRATSIIGGATVGRHRRGDDCRARHRSVDPDACARRG